MERLTREKDMYECRIAGGCPAEEWMYDLYDKPVPMNKNECDECPFEVYINKLAEYEDKNEYMEDDGK